MSTDKVSILVLEDDEVFASALQEFLTQSDFTAYVFNQPHDAIDFLNKNKVDYVLSDCLLPQMSGLDFLEKIQQQIPNIKAKYILMSGIYNDKNYIQESIKKTKAIAFLKKPFDMAQLTDLLKKEDFKKEEVSSRKKLYQIFANENLNGRQKRKLIEALDEISGFDLPIIYSLLIETKTSGYLNIYDSKGAVSGISICEGQIVGVDADDKSTFLGEMLIHSGFVTPENVKNALKDKKNRKMGSYLVESNLLSPHAFDIILAEQMNIRLSRMIVDEKIKVNFSFTDVDFLLPAIDSDMLIFYLHDWIASKINSKWLKSFYTLWSGHIIQKTKLFIPDHPALKMSLVQSLDGFVQKIENNTTLNQILEDKNYNEVAVFKAIHFLLIKGLVVFSPRAVFASEKEQYQTLMKIHKEIENKSSLEIIEYMESCTFAGTEDVGGLKQEFVKLLGESPVDKMSDVYRLWSKLHQLVENASKSGGDQNLRQRHKQTVLKNEAEAKLQASGYLEEAKKCLQLNQFKKAQDFLYQIQKLKVEPHQYHIINAWVKIGLLDPQKKDKQLKEIEMEILQIPPDEKYDPLFPFINGLLAKVKGDFMGSKKHFEKSLALDPSFIVARREISLLEGEFKKKQDVLKMDLKDLVSGFFKKK
ncbi:MAG: response regulator [Pseudobdellovibrionaceae bacterium]